MAEQAVADNADQAMDVSHASPRSPHDTGAHGRAGGPVGAVLHAGPAHPIAQRRIDEIDADLHDHIAHERARGTSDRRIALSIVSRMVRGLAADASWRGRHATTGDSDPTIGIVLAAAFILLLPLLAMQFTDEVAWGPADFASPACSWWESVSSMGWPRGRRATPRTEPPSALRSRQRSSSSG